MSLTVPVSRIPLPFFCTRGHVLRRISKPQKNEHEAKKLRRKVIILIQVYTLKWDLDYAFLSHPHSRLIVSPMVD